MNSPSDAITNGSWSLKPTNDDDDNKTKKCLLSAKLTIWSSWLACVWNGIHHLKEQQVSKMSKRMEECTEQSDLPKKRANKTTGRNLPRKYDLKSCQHAIQWGDFECFIEFTAWKYLRLAHPWILPKDLFPIPCEMLGCATFQVLRRQNNTISIYTLGMCLSIIQPLEEKWVAVKWWCELVCVAHPLYMTSFVQPCW